MKQVQTWLNETQYKTLKRRLEKERLTEYTYLKTLILKDLDLYGSQ